MGTFIRAVDVSEIEVEVDAEKDDPNDFAIERGLFEKAKDNVWAWCTITVRARWGAFKGEAYLSECSYESKDDFLENNCEVFDGMFVEAMNDLHDHIEMAARKLEPLVTKESVDEWIVSKIQEG